MKSLRSIGRSVACLHRREMIEMAIEKRRLGQHGDRRGARALVAARNRRRIVIGLQHASRWRAALALGNDVQPVRLRDSAALKRPGRGSTAAARRSSSSSGTCAARTLDHPLRGGDDSGEQIRRLRGRRHACHQLSMPRSSRRASSRDGAGIDRLRGALDSFAHRGRLSADEQRRPGIEQHDVAARSFLVRR